MKSVLFFLLVIFPAALMARQKITGPVGPRYPVLVKKDTLYPSTVNPDLRLQRMEGRYSHTTAKGKVYIMAPDNMPCLVPDDKKIAPMPGADKKLRIRPVMPNTLPVVPLIPRSKS